MTRLVFETTDADKAALAAALEPAGKTFTDWFEEQLADTITPVQIDLAASCMPEAQHPRDIADATQVASDIQNADWSFVNDETGFLTHDIHPYPAKYIPQIPANLIRRLSLPGELVLDPFGGSGTTATESVRLSRRAVSVDANPLATLIGKVKTAGIKDEDRTELERLATAVYTYSLESSPVPNIDLFKKWLPEIPNHEKWFSTSITAELACIRHLIEELTSGRAKDIAYLAFSRIIVRVSNQDSETRYVSKEKNHAPKYAIRAYLESIKAVRLRVERFSQLCTTSDATFHSGDSRFVMRNDISPESVGLIVSSPPYPNATDYHLYHRFRIFWLGHNPKKLGDVEIGSHLKHQRKNTGFEEYVDDMSAVFKDCFNVLSPGRYAVFVVGDAVFSGETIDTAAGLAVAAEALGFEHVVTVERPIHQTRRSFSAAARRARAEKLLVLRKPEELKTYNLSPTTYRLWDYEEILREREVKAVLGDVTNKSPLKGDWSAIELSPAERWKLNRLTFTSMHHTADGLPEKTWQKLLENGDSDTSKRKEPKYVTHGLHAYKGKFYPQLAKSLINIAQIEPGSIIFDPFSGSGTVALEGYLNGFKAFGCDMNPLAVKIGKAKSEILQLPQSAVDRSLSALAQSLKTSALVYSSSSDQFSGTISDELKAWFPEKVISKLNWLLKQIRLFGEDRLVSFLETIVSDCIREVSQQDPTDLRIRRRSTPIEDAPLVELFLQKLETQHRRLQHFWSVSSRRPFAFHSPTIIQGDSREPSTFDNLGLKESSVDAIITSPPYATALPYIDTDRLSLMAILGIPSNVRKSVEEKLTGSREIARSEKNTFEKLLYSEDASTSLPKKLIDELKEIHQKNILDGAGFRKLNMPSLLLRYFLDMKKNIENTQKVLRVDGKAFYVVGNSKTKVGENWFPIKTTEWLLEIGDMVGLQASRYLDISVTTENLRHMKHAITENGIIQFIK